MWGFLSTACGKLMYFIFRAGTLILAMMGVIKQEDDPQWSWRMSGASKIIIIAVHDDDINNRIK